MYKSKKWQRLRKAVLARDNYQDQELKRYGKNVQATVVHHCLPVEDYPEYRWCSWNLVSVSAKTHNELHDRNTNALTDKGRELMERVARKRGINHGREEDCKEEVRTREESRTEEDHGKEDRDQSHTEED